MKNNSHKKHIAVSDARGELGSLGSDYLNSSIDSMRVAYGILRAVQSAVGDANVAGSCWKDVKGDRSESPSKISTIYYEAFPGLILPHSAKTAYGLRRRKPEIWA